MVAEREVFHAVQKCYFRNRQRTRRWQCAAANFKGQLPSSAESDTEAAVTW